MARFSPPFCRRRFGRNASGVRMTSTCGAPGARLVPVFGILLFLFFLSCGRRGGAGGQA